ncbi:hypothetical protein TNCV_1904341 [Trichonephila clavipes]|nr:hypothetical protein TNCV_1904341 [Trichonephila clavipes]
MIWCNKIHHDIPPFTPHGPPNYFSADVDSLHVVIDPWGVYIDQFGNHCPRALKNVITPNQATQNNDITVHLPMTSNLFPFDRAEEKWSRKEQL